MAHSLSYNYIHLVFSTKNREPHIVPEMESKLYNYIAGVGKNFDSPVLQIGGIADHIHVLFNLSRKMSLSDFVEEIKKNSSKWIKTQGDYANFYWQSGYGAFSVNPKQIDVVKNYIANQKQHHHRKTFQQEYLEFLTQYNAEYDERYVWN